MQKPSQQQNATESSKEMITAAVTSTKTTTQMKNTEKKSAASGFAPPSTAAPIAATSSSAFQASKGPTLNDKISGIHLDMSFTGLLNNTTQSDFKESFNFGPFGTVKPQEGAMVAGAGTSLKAHDQQPQLSQDVILKNLQKMAALEDENRNLRRRLKDMENSAVKNDTETMEDVDAIDGGDDAAVGFNGFKESGPISLAELREKPITSRLQYYQRIKTIE